MAGHVEIRPLARDDDRGGFAAKSIEHTMRVVVEMLARQEYSELERLTVARRLLASEIEAGVEEYGSTIVMPPNEAFSGIDVVEIGGSSPPAYSVRFRLHTLKEAPSDLELQATFRERPAGEMMEVELDNIIVA